MAEQPIVSVAVARMNMDSLTSSLKEGEYCYALNAVIENFNGLSYTLQNEQGNERCAPIPDGYKVIGRKNISQLGKILFLLTNPTTGDSEIGLVETATCKYSTLISDVGNECKFGFSIHYPVHKIHIKTDNCSTQAFWTDGLNPRRFIDFDDLPWVETIDPSNVYKRIKQVGKLDCNKLKVQANFSIPKIRGYEETIGGTLVTGVYQGIIQYANSVGDGLTSFYNATNPISIFEQKESPDFNLPTSKAITFEISNLDTTGLYEYFNLVVVKTINAISTPEFVGTFPIAAPIYRYTYTGTTKTNRTLNMEDIFIKYPYYDVAGDSFEVNNLIGWSQLKEEDEPNYQLFWNKVKLYWESHKIPYNQFQGFTNGLNSERYRGYMGDEVYALEGCFILKNGKQTKACHIPSRLPKDYDLELIPTSNLDNAFSTIDKCNLPEAKPRWKVYNTAYVTGETVPYVAGDCYIGPYRHGEFAYWESEDRYPTNTLIWGELAGKPIRHHKFPDSLVSPIHDNNINNDISFEHSIFPIGIKVDAQSIIDAFKDSGLTQEQIDNIAGFKILRGDRVSNKSVIAKGLVHNVGETLYDSKTYLYPNYTFNDLRPDPFFVVNKLGNHIGYQPIARVHGFDKQSSQKRFTFHSPDTSFYQPSISNIGEVIKFESVIYGKADGHFVKVKNNAEYKFLTPRTISAAAGIAIASGVVIGAGMFGWPNYNMASAIPSYTGTIEMFEKLTPYTNFGYTFNSVGDYCNSFPIPNSGNKQRGVDYNKYLVEGFNGVEDGKILNNFRRETSVYIASSDSIPFAHEYSPLIPRDTSRYSLASIDDGLAPEINRSSNICSYYASLKREIVNQWGQLYSYKTIDTGFYSDLRSADGSYINRYPTIFGGDIFINRFSYKSKIPLFRENTVTARNQTDIAYDEVGNINYPMFWISTKSERYDIDLDKEIEAARKEFLKPSVFDIIANILGGGAKGSVTAMKLVGKIFSEVYSKLGFKNVNMDRASSFKLFEEGIMYLYAYGIPYFFCESEVNVDYRQAINQREGNFYPNVGRGIPDDWLQEVNVPIVQDNFYVYNKSYSWQNELNYFSHLREDYDPNKKCFTEFPNRAIWSEPSSLEETKNNWLIYKPTSRFDFPKSYGALVSMDGIEDRQIVVGFENKTLLYNALYTAPTSAGDVYLGKALFDSTTPPLDYADTDLGYVGTQHKMFLKTEAGHLKADALRGQVFLIQGQKIEDLSDKGMSKFFKEFLKFEITKVYPDFPIDNHFNGCGLHAVYDNKYNRILLTKIDYKPLKQLELKDGKLGHTKTKTITKYPPICSPGFTYVNGVCIKDTLVPATKVSDVEFIAVSTPRNEYSIWGSALYSSFNPNGTGTYTLLPTNHIWTNIDNNLIDGPLNRTGLWNSVSGEPLNTWVGLTKIVINDTDSPKTYYVGLGADNQARISVNCEPIMTQDPNMIADQHVPYYVGITFRRWHVYPIVLQPGVNYLTIENMNLGSVGILGCEVYDNTAEELQNATTIDDLKIIFTTADLFNKTVEAFNYSCGSGECSNRIIEIDGKYYCPGSYLIESPNLTPTIVTVSEFEEVPFTNTEYFCNNSFTISFNLKTNGWTSFHSYIPNYYVGDNNIFFSGRNDNQFLWKHNNSISLFNNYYGNREKYIIEYPLYYKGAEEILQSIKDYSKILKFTDFDEFVETDDVYFSHAIISNDQQSSGTLKLTKKPKNSLGSYNKYPIYHADEKEILYTKSNSMYQFNTFWALQRNSQQPMWKRSCESLSIFKEINNDNMNYSKRSFNKAPLMSKDARIRLINNTTDEHKFISTFIISETTTSFK